MHAFVFSKIDYCNSLLHGLPTTSVKHLQRIQNIAARILSRTKKFDHITPVLMRLHWLPVEERIIFKVLLLTFQALNGLAPQYLEELLTPYMPSKTLRSSEQKQLSVPPSRLKSYGDRSFCVAAPRLWNSLPADIRDQEKIGSFKSKLKTYLFTKAFL